VTRLKYAVEPVRIGTALNPSSWAGTASENKKQSPRRPAFATFLGHPKELHIIVLLSLMQLDVFPEWPLYIGKGAGGTRVPR
jgi:hypothetical protein